MYKNKITQWGLDKNNKRSETMAMVRKRTERAAFGKESCFKVRGRVVSPEELDRYLKRARVVTAEMVRAHSASTPRGLECFTPLEVPGSPTTPEVFSKPESILIKLGDHITGSFEAGTWTTGSREEACESIKDSDGASAALGDLITYTRLACDFFEDAKADEGGRMLAALAAGISKIVLAELPAFWSRLFIFIIGTRNWGNFEIVQSILRQFSNMAAVLLPEIHPIRQICQHLASLEPGPCINLSTLAFQSATDRFEGILGLTHYTTVRYRFNCIWARADDSEQEELALRKFLARYVAVRGGHDATSLKLNLAIAECLLAQEKWTEAEGMASDCVAHAFRIESPYSKANQHKSLYFLARAQSRLGKIDLAETSFWQVIEMAASTWGWNDAETIRSLVKLERHFKYWGKETSAAEIRRKIREAVESMDVFV